MSNASNVIHPLQRGLLSWKQGSIERRRSLPKGGVATESQRSYGQAVLQPKGQFHGLRVSCDRRPFRVDPIRVVKLGQCGNIWWTSL